jgi:hypothetical protein
MSLLDLPDSYPVAEKQDTLCVGQLSEQEKQRLWVHLKQHHPKKAEEIKIIMNDEIIINLQKMFGATLLIEKQYVPAYLLHLINR